MHTVVETPTYLRNAKTAGLSDDERQVIVNYLSMHPDAGDLIPGTGGARKVRFGAPGRGKRGGYRVITFYAVEDVPIFLLALVSKSQRVDFTKAERNELYGILSGLVDDYRASVTDTVRRMT